MLKSKTFFYDEINNISDQIVGTYTYGYNPATIFVFPNISLWCFIALFLFYSLHKEHESLISVFCFLFVFDFVSIVAGVSGLCILDWLLNIS